MRNVDLDSDNLDIDPDYEAMVADLTPDLNVDEYGVDSAYEAWRADR